MRKIPTKAELSQDLKSDLERYLDAGNEVSEIPKGISGKEIGANYAKPSHWQLQKSEGDRTYLPHVVQRLDERKRPKPAPKASARRRPRKKLLYDDFGEPLRWVWVDE